MNTPDTPAPHPNPRTPCVPQAGDHLLLDVAPQFWTAPGLSDTFQDVVKGGQVGASAPRPAAARSKGRQPGPWLKALHAARLSSC